MHHFLESKCSRLHSYQYIIFPSSCILWSNWQYFMMMRLISLSLFRGWFLHLYSALSRFLYSCFYFRPLWRETRFLASRSHVYINLSSHRFIFSSVHVIFFSFLNFHLNVSLIFCSPFYYFWYSFISNLYLLCLHFVFLYCGADAIHDNDKSLVHFETEAVAGLAP